MSTFVHSSIEDQELIAERRKQFVTAATVLFGRNSYEATTMKEIAKKAGFSSGLIYSYVQTKEDMLFLVLQNILDSYRREIPGSIERASDPIASFCAAVRAYCRVVDANADATFLAYRSTKSLSSIRRGEIKKLELETNRLVADCIRGCIAAGYFRPVNVDLMAYQVVMVAHGWALKRWILSQAMTIEDYVRETIDSFLHMAMTEEGWERLLGGDRRRQRQGEPFALVD